MTGIFIVIAAIVGVLAVLAAIVVARRSRRPPGDVRPEDHPPSPPVQ